MTCIFTETTYIFASIRKTCILFKHIESFSKNSAKLLFSELGLFFALSGIKLFFLANKKVIFQDCANRKEILITEDYYCNS